MFCSNCGKKVEEDAVFCPDCGAKISSEVSQVPPVIACSIRKPMGLMYIISYSIFSGLATLAAATLAAVVISSFGLGLELLESELLRLAAVVISLFGLGIASGFGMDVHVTVGDGLLTMFLLLLSLSYIVVTYGLWNLIEWSIKLAIVTHFVGGIASLIGLLGESTSDAMVVISLGSFAISIGIIYFLTKPRIKKLFR